MFKSNALSAFVASNVKVSQFYDYLTRVRNYSPLTVEGYVTDLCLFSAWLAPKGLALEKIDFTILEQWVSHLSQSGYSSNTIARRIYSVHNYFKFLERYFGISSSSVMLVSAPKIEQNVPDVLAVSEVDSIIGSCDVRSRSGIRDRAILELMFSTGVRVSEVISLRLSDLYLSQALARIVGKGRKQRMIMLSDALVRYLREWLQVRATLPVLPEAQDLVFVHLQNYGPCTRYSMWRMSVNHTREAGVAKRVHPHTFRHSFATAMLDGGADLVSIQSLMGHESIATTQKYTHVSTAHLRRQLDACHPRGAHYRAV